MAVLEALFRSNPSVGWLAIACLLLAAELASAKMRFAWIALAALAPAFLNAAHVPLGGWGAICLFAALSGLAMALFARERRAIRARAPRETPAHGLPTPTAGPADLSRIERFGRARRPSSAAKTSTASARAREPAKTRSPASKAGDPARARTLVGQSARSLTEFSNGLGRVWLAGAEWGAELVAGDALAADCPVEVVGVSGGVRLRVRALGV